MRLALEEAARALAHADVPVGALIVQRGRILALRHNERERLKDPTAHAELLAIREAAAVAGAWRIPDATMYVTLEPCPMCAGALVLARLDRLVFGAYDPKSGAAGSVVDLVRHPELNHRLSVTAGILQDDCSALIRQFFAERR